MRLVLSSVLASLILTAPAAAADDLYIMAVRDNGSVVVARNSISREGGIVRLRSFTYLGVPSERDGREIRWVETQAEYDCQAHRTRRRVIGGYDHNAALIFLDARAAFGDWSDTAPESPAAATDAFACRDQRGPEVKPLASLALFPFVAFGKVASRFYVNSRQDEEGWRAMELPSINAGGPIVGVTEMVLMPRPQSRDGVAYHWVEAETEYDCVGHRRRDRGKAAFTLDLSRRRGEGDAEFRPWRSIGPGSPAREAEDFLCRNTSAATIRGFGDLKTLQASIAPGLR